MEKEMKFAALIVFIWSAHGWCAANPADAVVRSMPFNRDSEPLSVTPAEHAKEERQREAAAAKKRAEAQKKANEILGTPEPSNRAPDDGAVEYDEDSPGANQ